MVIFWSPDGSDETWAPLMPNQVPAWVQHPDTLAEMVANMMVKKDGTCWYRAELLN
ncbi:MAG TPA: hypothetical protein VJL10_07420 [Anaerolineales bacterium]|nr:hypothetical protein [Anaerolineales bacterium]